MTENHVTFVGNLTDEPELRFSASGTAISNFTIAINRRKKNDQGQWEDDEPTFVRCTAWKETAENAAESLTKGMRVVVTGRLEQSRWTTTEGEKRSSLEVQVDEVGPSLRWATATVQKTQRAANGTTGQ